MNDVPGSVQHRGAVAAFAEMRLHRGPKVRADVVLEVVGDLLPHMFAIDYHGFLPFPNGARPNQPSARLGVRMSRSISRALSRRVLTLATEILNKRAVSSMLMCSTSRNTN